MKRALLALAALALLAGPARAQPTPAAEPAKVPPPEPADDGKAQAVDLGSQLHDHGTVAADPQRSYIFFRTNRRMGVLFLREPDAAERDAEAAEAMRAAQQQYQGQLTEWRRVEAACQANGRSSGCRRPRPAPVEPTAEAVLAGFAPDRHIVIVYRNPFFSEEANGDFTYLLPVHPGTYALYGQRDGAGEAWAGVCLCMGSLRFDVAAGEVADLGTISYPALDAANAREATDSAFMDGGRPAMAIVPPGPDTIVPARLAALRVVPARLRAADKMDNLFGLYIDRHPALPGVLGYERDRVIDLAAAP